MNFKGYVEKFDMTPHLEHGYFKEIYRSKQSINNHRSEMSSIYFLMEKGAVTLFRQLNEIDEIIVFLDGNPIDILMIDKEGKIKIVKLGNDTINDENLEVVIPAKYIVSFKSIDRRTSTKDFSLFGCFCSPAFEYENLQLYEIDDIKKMFSNIDIKKINKFISND
jgi:predicted cupin superfamily sugar epimerase